MLEQILAALQGLTAAVAANTAALGADGPKAAKSRTAAAKDTAAAAGTPSTGTVAVTGVPTNPNAAGAASPSSVTAQAAGDAMVAVANQVSRDEAVRILGMFGAQTFAGVKPEAYAAFYAECQKSLAPKTVAAPAGAAGLF